VQGLESSDVHRLNAALGWLGLGSIADARAELEAISTPLQSHPAVLEARWLLLAHEQNWADALAVAEREVAVAPDEPSGWLHRAYALRRTPGGGLTQAWDALRPAADKFPREPIIAFNLSCYACQLAQPELARHWLRRAIEAGNQDAVKKMALNDEDLKPMWAEIKEL
jgi:Flp pilus assembly protein TadD